MFHEINATTSVNWTAPHGYRLGSQAHPCRPLAPSAAKGARHPPFFASVLVSQGDIYRLYASLKSVLARLRDTARGLQLIKGVKHGFITFHYIGKNTINRPR